LGNDDRSKHPFKGEIEMANRILLAALALAVAGVVGTAPVDAQDWPDYRVDFGVNAGGAWYTASLDDVRNDEDARLEPGWLFGSQLTFWLTDRFGVRANGAYTERPLIAGDIGADSDSDLLEDINVWSASGDLLFRFSEDGYSLGGIQSHPFFAAGVGVKQWNPAYEVEEQDYNVTYFNFGEQAVVEEFKLMGLLGLGTDFRLARNFAIRTELGTRFWDSPLRDATEFQFNPDEDLGKVVFEPYLQLGAHVLLGLEAQETVAVAPPPPEPAPEPVERDIDREPVEEEIVVCVVDPTAPGGLVEVDAIYMPETRDTMVVEGEMRRDFSTVVPRVMVANEADWFVRGEPLQLAIAEDATLEYTTWQSARMIPATQLTYLGMSRGLPVYAAADDVREIREEIEDARQAAMDDDLDDILEENAELAEAMEEVQYLYVPLRPTGCVFQAVRLIEQVRKK
jgi:hypothetical protein